MIEYYISLAFALLGALTINSYLVKKRRKWGENYK